MYVGLNCLKNLCLRLVSGVPQFFLGLHPCVPSVVAETRNGDNATSHNTAAAAAAAAAVDNDADDLTNAVRAVRC